MNYYIVGIILTLTLPLALLCLAVVITVWIACIRHRAKALDVQPGEFAEKSYSSKNSTSQLSQKKSDVAVSTAVHKELVAEPPIKSKQLLKELKLMFAPTAVPGTSVSSRKNPVPQEIERKNFATAHSAIVPCTCENNGNKEKKKLSTHTYTPWSACTQPDLLYAEPCKVPVRPLEIRFENIREMKHIGVGQYGSIILAEMVQLSGRDMLQIPRAMRHKVPLLVAVKRMKSSADQEMRKNFDKEIKFMSQIRHENIVQLLAVCTHITHPFIVMEYMENGDLSQFLQKYQLLEDKEMAVYSNQLPPSVLVYMAIQIASGMCYLSSLNYVHRDLATRNCLVGKNFQIKISDFGLSRNLYERSCYHICGQTVLPIRWMATECFYGRFSEKSDVWAYGVTVWEIFTLGKKMPYEDLDNQSVIVNATQGDNRQVLTQPPGCPREVFEVMLSCWAYYAGDRPAFREVYDRMMYFYTSQLF